MLFIHSHRSSPSHSTSHSTPTTIRLLPTLPATPSSRVTSNSIRIPKIILTTLLHNHSTGSPRPINIAVHRNSTRPPSTSPSRTPPRSRVRSTSTISYFAHSARISWQAPHTVRYDHRQRPQTARQRSQARSRETTGESSRWENALDDGRMADSHGWFECLRLLLGLC